MSLRGLYFIGFLIVVLLLSISIYLQLVVGLLPCPLCTLQRVCFFTLGILFLFGMFFYRIYFLRLTINFLLLLFSTAGIFFSGRQIWLQFFSTSISTPSNCPASLEYLIKILPANEVIKKILSGSPDCLERGWTFLYLDLAQWSFIWFIILFALCLVLLFKKNNSN